MVPQDNGAMNSSPFSASSPLRNNIEEQSIGVDYENVIA
jgi:hypothetical protein